MKFNIYVSSQEMTTRALQVLVLFVSLDNTAFGFKLGLLQSKLSFPRDRSYRRIEAKRAHPGSPKRSLGYPVISAMANVKEAYSVYHHHWKTFAESVPNKLNSKTPCALWSNVGTIADIINPSENVFYTWNTEDVIKRIMLTLKIADAYLKTLDRCRLIRRNPESQRFFLSHYHHLNTIKTIVKLALANLRYEAADDAVQIVHGGMGEFNTGIYRRMDGGIYHRLKELVHGLKSTNC